ncbi:MAG: hypothetical protein AB8F94_14680 [Saprospiraceae bacterium]
MNLLKKFVFSSFIILGMIVSNHSFAQVRTTSKSEIITTPKVEFTLNDIEKIKTLLEHHFKTRISDAQLNMYGKASDENLALYKLLDETRKEDPFFSQPHISFIIESMEERLGKGKPKAKSKLETPTKNTRNPKVSKLPKNKSDKY